MNKYTRGIIFDKFHRFNYIISHFIALLFFKTINYFIIYIKMYRLIKFYRYI